MWKSFQKLFDSQESFVSMALGLAVVLAIGVLLFNYVRQGRSAATTSQKEEQEQKQEQTSLPTKYTVKEGDTLWSIAETYYKSGYNWVSIQEANSLTQPDMIEVGQILTIPKAEPIVADENGQITAASSNEPGKTEKKTYTVKYGDNLWDIAVKEYGSGYEWVKIAQANNLVNPNIIHPSNVLTLP